MHNLAKNEEFNQDQDYPSIPSDSPSTQRSGRFTQNRKGFDREYWLNRMGKYSWIANLNQLFVGIGLIILAVWLAWPYLEGWVLGAAIFLFTSGVVYGWYISRQTDIYLSETRAAIFSYSGLWIKFAPMILILFILRFVLIYLGRQGILDTTATMRTLTFFIAGVFSIKGDYHLSINI